MSSHGQGTIPPQVANNAFICVFAFKHMGESMLQCPFLGVALVIFPTFFQDFIAKCNSFLKVLKRDSHL